MTAAQRPASQHTRRVAIVDAWNAAGPEVTLNQLGNQFGGLTGDQVGQILGTAREMGMTVKPGGRKARPGRTRTRS